MIAYRRENESVESLIKRFNKQMASSGKLRDINETVKPFQSSGEIRRLNRKRRKKRLRKKEMI